MDCVEAMQARRAGDIPLDIADHQSVVDEWEQDEFRDAHAVSSVHSSMIGKRKTVYHPKDQRRLDRFYGIDTSRMRDWGVRQPKRLSIVDNMLCAKRGQQFKVTVDEANAIWEDFSRFGFPRTATFRALVNVCYITVDPRH